MQMVKEPLQTITITSILAHFTWTWLMDQASSRIAKDQHTKECGNLISNMDMELRNCMMVLKFTRENLLWGTNMERGLRNGDQMGQSTREITD